MKNFKSAILLLLLSLSLHLSAQERSAGPNIKVTGKVLEKVTGQPLEYATVTFSLPGTPRAVAGGITDPQGNFNISVAPGTYDISIEFISFQVQQIKQRALTADTNLGVIQLAEDATMLNEVVVRAESTTVEIKLDKKVYNVGNDLMVKGGTVSDVLDNIPSVSVDAEGTVSLRGNENVRILIDGRPSNAINITEALRLIPADAIEKVEVVTNPSARYESEGGGGLINIILKKGKNQGINGTIIATVGDPENYGISANVNYKTDKFNVFTTTGYNYRNNPGNALTNTEYLKDDGTTENFIVERRTNERLSKGYNTNFGMEWYLDASTTWTNTLTLRKYSGENPESVIFDNFSENREYLFTTTRFNDQVNDDTNFEYATNFTKNFKKEGHKLTVDGSFSRNIDSDDSNINNGLERTGSDEDQSRNILQADYVLPFGKDSQFEAGYKGDFNSLLTDFRVDTLNVAGGDYLADMRYTNELEYKEQVNALYSQYGTKFNKFSVLLGLRFEDSKITVNQFTSDDFNVKRYSNFFPSAFLTYELSEKSSVSLSYSRRISRPRGRMINPFSNYSSNINLFQGNPDLDPSFTNAFDLGYLKRWQKLTLSASMYLNRTTDAFQFVRRESGEFVVTPVGDRDTVNPTTGEITIIDGADIRTPVILTTPINLGVEYRFGFEFTTNYSPYKWWRLNSNFNFFRNETQGDFTYINSENVAITENFDNIAFSWFTRLTSKITLPHNIEWQTNFTYNGPQTNAQGRSKGIASANLAFSKDLFKESTTLSLNVQDVFNSRKRITETNLPGLNSYSEMQWRVRQVNLSLTYRFNRKKNERESTPKREVDNGEEFPG
ncbi:MAG TPA: TonB-dependent receptor [Flavobacterium sp.]|nr:TonB-dependent receptor [Flavobacterium sp.]